MENPFRITTGREKLEPLLEKAGLRWGDYTRCREGALDLLERKGLLVMPETGRYKNLSDKQLKVIQAIAERQGQQVVVIPYEAEMFPSWDSKSVAKKYPLLPVRFDSQHTLQETLKSKMREVSIDDVLVGYDWHSPVGNEKRFIVTTLVDCIKGHLLDGMIGDGEIEVKPYTEPGFTPGYDMMASVKGMPSLSDETGYDDFRIEGILLSEKGKKIEMPEHTYQLCTSHECKKDEFYPIKYGRKIILLGNRDMMSQRTGKEKLECYHSVLAVKKAKKIVMILHGLEMSDPFIEPTKKCTEQIFDATRRFIVYQDREGYFHNLNETHSEILLWKYIGYLNQIRNERK